ncbi:PAS domain-containing sensor histidine kinase [Alkalicaulis satelles]|uniref:histidine kinase n=2 Tax=Alkalicaulis satelles TaxID=2609175 RepID=A0A5M6ZNK9_9PROT|nr:PAS domain-containing sensor histidine kinase [Alkalicaulis satelles]
MILKRDSRRGRTGARKTAQSLRRGASSRLALMLVMGFVLAFGGVISIKLYQDWRAAESAVEAAQTRNAAFIAERLSGRIAEVRSALAMTAAQLDALSPAGAARNASQALETLTRPAWVEGAALLLPDGRIISSLDLPDTVLRNAADDALAAGQGVAARAGSPHPIVSAHPVRLADGTVGAVLAFINPNALLPGQAGEEIAFLTDASGRLLALKPAASFDGAPLAAERVGLDPGAVARMAERGGAMRGAQLAGADSVLGAASVAGAPLHALTLGPGAVNSTTWRQTLLFNLLLFAATLGASVALFLVLRKRIGELGVAEGMLRESQNRLTLAMEGARVGVWDWDLESDSVLLTESFAQILGRTRAEEVSGPEFLLLISEEDRNKVRAALRSAAQTDELDVMVRAAQLAVWFQMRGRIMDGTRRLVGVAIDITERKGAQARVQAAESRLRAALESMTESFVLWDSRRRLMLWNRKFREFFGLSDTALRGNMRYEEVEAMAAKAIARVHGEPGADSYELELKDGRWLHYSDRRTNDGGIVSVGADITALKTQETALRDNERALRRTVENLKLSQARVEELAEAHQQERVRAEEANRSKSEFLANMSHELRTPLNAINGFSEIMAGEMFGPLGDERYKGYVTDILGSGQHLLSLINDILDMSKIEAGKMQLQTELILPGDVIEQCVRIMRARAEEKSITLAVEAESLPEIEADPRALKQVLLNLMSNAVKFTPEGGAVKVRGFDAADGVVLQVADTGIGIPAEHLPRLGRPFEQIESQTAKSHQGSGLGLALSKSLIELHGGTLRIDSAPGKGTTVSFSLPARLEAPAPVESDPAGLQQAGQA